MAGFSDYLETAFINASLRGTNFTAPATNSIYVALFTADPTDAGNINEVSAAWYARQPSGTWTAPAVNGTAMQSTNNSSITFPAVTGASATVTHFGVFDALTLGNMLYSNSLTAAKTLGVGDVLSFAPGALIIALD